jgi:uracil-DNA glycosylase family 4
MDRNQLLREMGLGPVWRLRQPVASAEVVTPPPADAVAPTTPQLVNPTTSRVAEPVAKPMSDAAQSTTHALDWPGLAQAVSDCRACALCATRKQAVLGVGDVHADWLFVGEGPGAEEDERGEPFVGQAGKLLDNMIAAIGLRRGEDVYIANTVKCRPPNNRTPEATETAACFAYLERQIDLIQPKLIVALGKPAMQTLLSSDASIASMRGKQHSFRGIPVIVTYHPAYLLRNLPDKAKAWEDLVFMRTTMRALKEKSA